jgi:MFS family permease
MLGTNANFLSYVLVANATRPIIAELGFSNSFQWIFSVYTIAVSTSLLITGRLSDIFGRRWFIIGGNFCNCLGAIIAAVAQDIPTVIVGMMFIGLGGAVQLSFPAIIGERTYTLLEIVRSQGVIVNQLSRRTIDLFGWASSTSRVWDPTALVLLWRSHSSPQLTTSGDGASTSISSSRVRADPIVMHIFATDQSL